MGWHREFLVQSKTSASSRQEKSHQRQGACAHRLDRRRNCAEPTHSSLYHAAYSGEKDSYTNDSYHQATARQPGSRRPPWSPLWHCQQPPHRPRPRHRPAPTGFTRDGSSTSPPRQIGRVSPATSTRPASTSVSTTRPVHQRRQPRRDVLRRCPNGVPLNVINSKVHDTGDAVFLGAHMAVPHLYHRSRRRDRREPLRLAGRQRLRPALALDNVTRVQELSVQDRTQSTFGGGCSVSTSSLAAREPEDRGLPRWRAPP